MDTSTMLGLLEELAQKLEVEIRYEELEGDTPFHSGGLCRVRGKQIMIINKRATPSEKVATIGKALGRFDLSRVYLKPAIREFLEGPMKGEA